ncbi:MAG: hypothetical protein ACI87E_004710, partial [Mariniblastus sp.]
RARLGRLLWNGYFGMAKQAEEFSWSWFRLRTFIRRIERGSKIGPGDLAFLLNNPVNCQLYRGSLKYGRMRASQIGFFDASQYEVSWTRVSLSVRCVPHRYGGCLLLNGWAIRCGECLRRLSAAKIGAVKSTSRPEDLY